MLRLGSPETAVAWCLVVTDTEFSLTTQTDRHETFYIRIIQGNSFDYASMITVSNIVVR